MTILNWFSILAIMVIIGLYTWVGYLWGKLDTQKKWLKDLKEINSKLKEANDLRQYEPDTREKAGLKSASEAY